MSGFVTAWEIGGATRSARDPSREPAARCAAGTVRGLSRAASLAGTRPRLPTLTFAGTAATGGADDVGGGAAGADAEGERRTERGTTHASCPAAAAALAWVGPPRVPSCTACSARPIPPATIVPAVVFPQARVCAAALARGPPHGCPRTSTTRVSIAARQRAWPARMQRWRQHDRGPRMLKNVTGTEIDKMADAFGAGAAVEAVASPRRGLQHHHQQNTHTKTRHRHRRARTVVNTLLFMACNGCH